MKRFPLSLQRSHLRIGNRETPVSGRDSEITKQFQIPPASYHPETTTRPEARREKAGTKDGDATTKGIIAERKIVSPERLSPGCHDGVLHSNAISRTATATLYSLLFMFMRPSHESMSGGTLSESLSATIGSRMDAQREIILASARRGNMSGRRGGGGPLGGSEWCKGAAEFIDHLGGVFLVI
jgi:hypothetical protein